MGVNTSVAARKHVIARSSKVITTCADLFVLRPVGDRLLVFSIKAKLFDSSGTGGMCVPENVDRNDQLSTPAHVPR